MKIDFQKFKAAIFDMDGTMINNMHWHNKAWEEFVKRKDIDSYSEDFHKKYFGKKNEHILRDLLGQHLTDAEVNNLADEKESIYRDLYSPQIKGLAGLGDFINAIKKKELRLAVATSAPKKNREFTLKALGLEEIFSVIVGSEDVIHGKPDPEIFLKTAERLGISPKECLVFEDSPVGIESAKRAGMTTVGVLTTHSKEELHQANHFIKDFTDIET